jgi:hypothetical protein
MAQDPQELGHGSGENGDPATGTPAPSGDAEIARLKEENAKLRADRRNDRVRSLVVQHDLSATQALELASLGDLNEIESKAAEFVQAKPAAPAGAPAAAPAPVPSGEPADAGQLASMETGGEGAQPTPANLSWVEQMNAEVNSAGSLAEIQEIQNRYKAEHQQ